MRPCAIRIVVFAIGICGVRETANAIRNRLHKPSIAIALAAFHSAFYCLLGVGMRAYESYVTYQT